MIDYQLENIEKDILNKIKRDAESMTPVDTGYLKSNYKIIDK